MNEWRFSILFFYTSYIIKVAEKAIFLWAIRITGVCILLISNANGHDLIPLKQFSLNHQCCCLDDKGPIATKMERTLYTWTFLQGLFTPHLKSKVDDPGSTYYCIKKFVPNMAVIVCKLKVVYLIKWGVEWTKLKPSCLVAKRHENKLKENWCLWTHKITPFNYFNLVFMGRHSVWNWCVVCKNQKQGSHELYRDPFAPCKNFMYSKNQCKILFFTKNVWFWKILFQLTTVNLKKDIFQKTFMAIVFVT